MSRRVPRLAFLTAVALYAAALPAAGQTTYSWAGTGTDWLSPATWSPAGVPSAADAALFQNTTQVGQTPLPTFSGNAAAGSVLFDLSGVDLSSAATALRGNGNTLTLGTGGAMAASPLQFRGPNNRLAFDNLVVNLAAGTTLTGPAATAGFLEVGRDGFLTLRGGARLETAGLPVTLNGGVVSVTGTSSLASSALRFLGGGQLAVTGGTTPDSNPGVSSYAFGGIDARSGQVSVPINLGFASGQTANTVRLTFGGGGVRGLSLPFPTSRALVAFSYPFSATQQTPAQVFFDGFGGLVTNGVIRDGGTPYVTLDNRWATYDPANGLVPAATVRRDGADLSAGTAAENVVATSLGAAATLANDVEVQTLVIDPFGSASLDFGGRTLTTNGLIYNSGGGTGLRRLTLTNGSLAGTGGSVRQIVVNSGNTEIAAAVNLAAGGPIAKSGTGNLVLTGTTDQLAFANGDTDVTVNAGQLRAVIGGPTRNLGLSNVLQLRGGFLTADAQGGTASFTRPLGVTAGSVNWATGPGDHGSGGFGAFAGNLTVDIGGAGQQLVWDGQTGPSQYFVRDGQALLFTAPAGSGVLDFRNPIALDAGEGARTTRVIQAGGNPNFRPGVLPAVERTRITGVISGSRTTNLNLPLAAGTVELPTANTYAGDTSIGNTVVVTNTTGSATGTGNVVLDVGTLFGTGTIAPASGNGFQSRGGFVILQSDAGPSNLTIGSPGADNDVLLAQRVMSQATQFVARLTPAGNGRLTVLGTGQISVGGGTVLLLDPAPDFAPTAATALAVIANQTGNPIGGLFTVNGAVVGQGEQAVVGDWRYRLSYTGSVDGSTVLPTGGNSLVLYAFTPVPEPAGVLAVVAVTAAAGRRIARRRG